MKCLSEVLENQKVKTVPQAAYDRLAKIAIIMAHHLCVCGTDPIYKCSYHAALEKEGINRGENGEIEKHGIALEI